ncbi:MAG: FHA domain-containing protein [Saprospiraceae bacterium]|jgi:hypothetical protein|nr:FHA domain-containing protein [Saprospiraceae bacterium]MCA0334393.1 FHA domain-containing protein [Bacteroidota bacterium]
MENQIVFGRTHGRRINKGDISGQHARITYLGDDMFEVEDLNSANGTYVNGYRIRKSKVSVNDEVRLSMDTVLDLSKEFKLSKSSPVVKPDSKDYTMEFLLLKDVYDEYKKDIEKYERRHALIVGLVRGSIMLIPLILYYLIGFLKPGYYDTKEGQDFSTQLFKFTIVGSTVAMIITPNIGKSNKKEEIIDNFRIRYVCPNNKCRQQLGNNSWRVWHTTGECPKCHVIYNKEKL